MSGQDTSSSQRCFLDRLRSDLASRTGTTILPYVSLGSQLVRRARDLSERAHAGQFRKAGNIPYFLHAEAVAKLVAAHGFGDELTVAAAYLHDVFEDQPAFAGELRGHFPREVVETVSCLSESKWDATGALRSKRQRFADYVSALRPVSEVTRRALPISCADKIHNLHSIVDSELRGSGLLSKLSTLPGEHLPQLEQLRRLYEPAVSTSMLAAFDEAVDALSAAIERWLPARAAQVVGTSRPRQSETDDKPQVPDPMRLAVRAEDAEVRTTVLLRDAALSGDWTTEALTREGFSTSVLRAIEALLGRPDESHADFLERIAHDRLATRVKLLELRHSAEREPPGAAIAGERAAAEPWENAVGFLEHQLSLRNLYVLFDSPSVAKLKQLATLPVIVAEHVTLKFRADPEEQGADAFQQFRAGDRVELTGVALHQDRRVQAMRVGLGSPSQSHSCELHATISRVKDARAYESNAMLEKTKGTPMRVPLSGRVSWEVL